MLTLVCFLVFLASSFVQVFPFCFSRTYRPEPSQFNHLYDILLKLKLYQSGSGSGSGSIDPLLLNLGIRWSERSVSRFGCFTPGERSFDIRCSKCWVDLRASVAVVESSSLALPGIGLRLTSLSLQPTHYADCTIPASLWFVIRPQDIVKPVKKCTRRHEGDGSSNKSVRRWRLYILFIKKHVTETYWGLAAQCDVILTSILGRGKTNSSDCRFTSGKEVRVSIGQEAGWTSDTLWTLWRGTKSLALPWNQSQIPGLSTSQSNHYTDSRNSSHEDRNLY